MVVVWRICQVTLLFLFGTGWVGARTDGSLFVRAQEVDDLARSRALSSTKTESVKSELRLDAEEQVSDGDHGHVENSSPNPLVIDPDLAIVSMVVFLLLLWLLTKFAWRPIVVALKERERNIADNISSAEAQREEARRLLSEYEKKLAGTTEQIRQLLEEARYDAEQTKAEIIGEAKAAAQSEQERALREVKNATDGALKELAEQGARLAVELAGKIVGEKLATEDHSQLIREAINKFPSHN